MSAADMNSTILVGRITRDPVMTYTSSGTPKCEFSIAVNRRVKKGEQWEDQASFFEFTLWDKKAEGLQKFLTKGQQVAVRAELEQHRWEKDGTKFSKVQFANVEVQLLGGRRESGAAPSGAAPGPGLGGYEDDIPF